MHKEIKVFCPKCKSPNLEYSESVDLLQCLNCSVVVWDEEILNRFKYPVYAPLGKQKILQISEFPNYEQ